MDTAVHAAEQPTRRSFLGYMIAAVGAFVATTLGTSSAIFAASPLFSQKKSSQVTLGPASGFQVGVPKAVEFSMPRKDGWVTEETMKAVWVVRQGDSNFTVFAGRCTHLGCAFSWHEDQKQFLCPCHSGRFAITGEVLGGPPPRPLDKLDVRLVDGKLVADYKDFRLGVPDKVEA